MFPRLLFKSTLYKPGSLLWTLLTLTACSALMTLFVTSSLGIGERMSGEFNRLGSNAVIAPHPQEASTPDTPARQAEWSAVERVARQFHVRTVEIRLRVGVVQGLPLGFADADPDKLAALTPYWRIEGTRAERPGQCLVGARVARRLHLEPGDRIGVRWNRDPAARNFRVSGVLHSGDSDDGRVFVTAFNSPSIEAGSETAAVPAASRRGAARTFTYGLLAVPGGLNGVKSFAAAVRGQHLSFEINPVRQVLYGERSVLKKTILLFALALVAVLALTVLGLTAAVVSRTLERSREISLMRAVGAGRRTVAALLLSESALKGAVAGLAGFFAGSWLAEAAGRMVFHAGFPPRAEALAAALGLSVAVSLLAALAGIRRALNTKPAMLLRSE